MTTRHTFRAFTVIAAIAMATALGTGSAAAQPAGGPHGPGGPGAMFGHLFEHARTQLNLNTMQQQMFDQAVAGAKAAREAAQALHLKVRDTLQVELAKTEPDLKAIAAAADAARDQSHARRQAVRNEWLALYGTFSAEQKAVVRELLQQRLARAESFRHRMREGMHRRFDGASG
jgi:Spy/CpxP family protein refolding chaperone